MTQDYKSSTSEHETKFVITNSKSHQVIEWLRCSCKPDPQFPSGTVSSIYFDSWTWRFLGEKLNSDYLKTKVRIRWYSDIKGDNQSDYSFAEAKYKVGNGRKKIRIKTDYTGEWLSTTRLDDERFLAIPSLLMSKGVVLNENVFPAYQISYKRLRFIERLSGVRLCFDYDICAPRVNTYMLPRSYPFRLQTAVFEIKGGIIELPPQLYPLTDMGCRKASFSKYSVCFQKLTGNGF